MYVAYFLSLDDPRGTRLCVFVEGNEWHGVKFKGTRASQIGMGQAHANNSMRWATNEINGDMGQKQNILMSWNGAQLVSKYFNFVKSTSSCDLVLCLGPSKSPEKFGARKNIFTFPPGPPKYPGGPIETYKKNLPKNFQSIFFIFSHKISVPKIIFYIFFG